MKTIGLDIGTTTISAVLLDTVTKQVMVVKTIPNTTTVESSHTFEKMQDADLILKQCQVLLAEIFVAFPQERIAGIGVTGQMHGILYVDAMGNAVSPLYTWQDQRGNQIYDRQKMSAALSAKADSEYPVNLLTNQDKLSANFSTEEQSYAAFAQGVTGYHLATGFGAVTHFYHSVNGSLPENATCFCTVADFVAMKLAGLVKPLVHPSMAASMGLFNLQEKCFDQLAVEKLQLQMEYFPEVKGEECWLGQTKEGIGVTIALGDNQASFLGAVHSCVKSKTTWDIAGRTFAECGGDQELDQLSENVVLLNIGTGSQISIFSEQLGTVQTGEYRPYLKDNFLWAGSPLCGGYSYHILKEFFTETLQIFGATPNVDIYEAMNQVGKSLYDTMETTALVVDTRFKGTRENPDCLGNIMNIAEETWRPNHLILGFLKGICRELYEYHQAFLNSDNDYILVGSGNGLRKNPLLRQICSDMFGKELIMSALTEEAACGSAFLAAIIPRSF